MRVTVAYEILFEVRVLHHYFLNRANIIYDRMASAERTALMLQYDCREFLDIRPTKACELLLRSHHCIFKQTSSGFVVGLQVEADPDHPGKVRPFIPFEDKDYFNFTVQISDMNFWNYTALPFTGNSGKMFLFRNKQGNVPIQFPSLTVNPPLYQADAEYLPGDMVGSNAANPVKLFTAKLKTKKGTSAGSDWLEERKADGFPMHYANGNDRVQVLRDTVNYQVKTPGVVPEVSLINEAGTVLTLPFTRLPGDPAVLQLDLRHFPEGIYTLHAESAAPAYADDITFFLPHQREIPFAMIHLSLKSNVPDYHMTDDHKDLLSPVYMIRFRNRATHWRYVGKNFNTSSVTNEPLPLTRFGVITDVAVPDKNGVMLEDLPNPGNTMIRTDALTSADEKKYYSEIHIH